MNNDPFEGKLGATGMFPDGKASEDDQGEVAFAVGIDKDKKLVLMLFKNPVKWFGMRKEEALDLAKLIVEKANEV